MALIHQFVEIVRQKMREIKHEPKDFADVCESLPMIKLKLKKSDLGALGDLQKPDVLNYKMYMQGYQKFCYHHWRPEDIRRASFGNFKGSNTGVLFWGEKGCGKSQILTYATAWAHESRWFNVTISDSESLIGGKKDLFRYKNGLYLQLELAHSMLVGFRHTNEELLREMDVDMSRYGKYEMTGVKDGDPQPCENTWDPIREKWSDDWKMNLFETEIQNAKALYETMDYRLSDRLRDPKKMIDICDYAIKHRDANLATNALAECLEQLYHTDKYKTLFTVDNINMWYQPSSYLSFRYENERALNGFVPPLHLALCRMFIRFDGHMVRNGVKLMATSHHHQFNHIDDYKRLGMFNGYQQKVSNLTLDEFRQSLKYYGYTGWMTGDGYEHEWNVESVFMET